MKKYNSVVVSIVLGIALVATAVWGYIQHDLMVSYRNGLNYQYQRYFLDMKDNVETIQSSLSKLMLSTSKEQNIMLLSQIYNQAYSAQEKLGQLPIRHELLRNTEKFLTQLGDYAFSLIQDLVNGREVKEQQMQTIFLFQDHTKALGSELQDTFKKVLTGTLNFKEIKKVQNEELSKEKDLTLDGGIVKYQENQLTDYPELIYDGPFSDQILNRKPRGLGEKVVTEEEAKKIALDFFEIKNPVKIIRFRTGSDVKNEENKKKEQKGADIESYTFEIQISNNGKDSIYVGVSKKGGKIIWAERPRNVQNKKLSKEEAIKLAMKKLSERGIKNLEPTYTETYNNTLLINTVYVQDKVRVYTDLVKIKIALDNGEIVGYDAKNYLINHIKRDIPKPSITSEEARDKVKYDFDVENVRLALIPDKGLNELLCYEFKGKYKGMDFIVYINAMNGREERILQVIVGKNGVLTM